MFLYNITIILEEDIHAEFIDWIDKYLFGGPTENKSTKLLTLMDSPHEGVTYCVQFQAKDIKTMTQFQEKNRTAIQQVASEKYAGKVLIFDSTMKYLK